MQPQRFADRPSPPRRIGLWKAFWLVFVLGGHGFALILLGLLLSADGLGLGRQLGPVFTTLLLAPLVLAMAALPVLLAPDRGEGLISHLLAKALAGITAALCLGILPLAALLLLSRLIPESP